MSRIVVIFVLHSHSKHIKLLSLKSRNKSFSFCIWAKLRVCIWAIYKSSIIMVFSQKMTARRKEKEKKKQHQQYTSKVERKIIYRPMDMKYSVEVLAITHHSFPSSHSFSKKKGRKNTFLNHEKKKKNSDQTFVGFELPWKEIFTPKSRFILFQGKIIPMMLICHET